MEEASWHAEPGLATFPASKARVDPPSLPAPEPERPAAQLGLVAIGASAGGLEASIALVAALPPGHGLALILVQHLEPTHDSMMVELLKRHTGTTVQQARDGVPVEADHLYIIPPASDLSVVDGTLRLSAPAARSGPHLPFDVLLHSLADACGPRTSCVILSGTGADGSLGIQTVKASGGFIIAQDPAEASYGGMPSSAIQTGVVDLVLRVADMPHALVQHDRLRRSHPLAHDTPASSATETGLAAIVDLLRVEAGHDFSHYKGGTLRRQVTRRMALAGLAADEVDRYLELLRGSRTEIDLLAKDLLIQVTSFFRDKGVFDVLGDTVIPDLIRNHPADRPIRIWAAGCSTGEEIYSVGMLFHEKLDEDKRNIRLHLFASDLDAGAVAQARAGRYPDAIEACVSKARLARFFSKQEHGYQVLPEMRSTIVFAVHDVLADPPFPQLDMVLCRNLLIYLQPEAQARVISLLHFALRPGGILMLGNAETPGNMDGRFEVLSKPEHLYRCIGRDRLAGRLPRLSVMPQAFPVAHAAKAPPSRAALMDRIRQRMLDAHAPASVLVDSHNHCLFSLGPVHRYVRLPSSLPSDDITVLAPTSLRATLRAALRQARANDVGGVTTVRRSRDGEHVSLSVEVRPILENQEKLLLVSFVEASRAGPDPAPTKGIRTRTPARVAQLERELEASRTELDDALREMDLSAEEQKAVDEEARSVNEEYQSTNEELMASKEELQALNEELTALNSQLQETLERQRTTSDDLQNVLYSTDVATLFLDLELRIRFFTPTIRLLFSVIPSDVGRPLADLRPLVSDEALGADIGSVLQTHSPIEREVEAEDGAWFRRRVLPYRTHDDRVEGVVITFNDITGRKHVAKALEVAKKEADLANAAKSRFLAAASHDLRQPLQTLSLLQGLLAKAVRGEGARQLVARLDETLIATTSMLNTLLDINQIEGGLVRPNVVIFPINDLLVRMRDEFDYHAQAKGLSFRVVPCGLSTISDVRLLEQMLRNLLANALKYTVQGKILLGCRRRDGKLSLQVWDTGVGIPEQELDAIFDEYHQVANPARERAHGLGLGLAIVQLLGGLLDHGITVRSTLGKGSMFALEVPLQVGAPAIHQDKRAHGRPAKLAASAHTATILLVEDDPDVRELTELTLTGEGYRVVSSSNVASALDLVAKALVAPDLILADHNLPGDMNGLNLAGLLRKALGREVPVVILTGDISVETARQVTDLGYVQLNKPVKHQELLGTVHDLVSSRRSDAASLTHDPTRHPVDKPTVFVVDDDEQICRDLRTLLEQEGHEVETFLTGEDYLHATSPDREGCILIDANLPGMSGLDLLHRLRADGRRLPAIMITGNSDVAMAVDAMKAGATDFIEKPVRSTELLASLGAALERSASSIELSAWQTAAAERLSKLTARQREILLLVLAGSPSKNIAADLHISQRTVENHRASIMKKTGAASMPALARLAMAATWTDAGNRNGDT